MLHAVVDEFYKDRPYDIGHLRPAIRLLRERGVDLEKADKDGMTPLHWAAFTGDVPAVRAFLAEGANVNARASHAFFGACPTVLMLAIQWAEILELLLNAGVDPRALDGEGRTALDLAQDALVQNERPMKPGLLLPDDPMFPQRQAYYLARQSENRERLRQSIAILKPAKRRT